MYFDEFLNLLDSRIFEDLRIFRDSRIIGAIHLSRFMNPWRFYGSLDIDESLKSRFEIQITHH